MTSKSVRKFRNEHTYKLMAESDSNGELEVTYESGFLNSWASRLQHLGKAPRYMEIEGCFPFSRETSPWKLMVLLACWKAKTQNPNRLE